MSLRKDFHSAVKRFAVAATAAATLAKAGGYVADRFSKTLDWLQQGGLHVTAMAGVGSKPNGSRLRRGKYKARLHSTKRRHAPKRGLTAQRLAELPKWYVQAQVRAANS